MQVKIGETKSLSLRDTSINGLLVNVYLKAAAVNTSFVDADFVAQEVLAKVLLTRNKVQTLILQDNLKIHGLYASLVNGTTDWLKGNIIVYKDVAVKEQKLISLFIDFGGIINIKEDDELFIEFTAGRACFTGNVDQAISFIEFNPNYAIGYEVGTPMIRSKVVQANISNEKFSLGDNIVKLAFLQFDKDDISANVLTNVNISSKQYSASLNFFDVLNRHWSVLNEQGVQYRYGNTQPVTAGNEAFPYLPRNPQSVILFKGKGQKIEELDNCQVDISFNSDNVNASQNYVVSTSYAVTRELLVKAHSRAQKHANEKAQSL